MSSDPMSQPAQPEHALAAHGGFVRHLSANAARPEPLRGGHEEAAEAEVLRTLVEAVLALEPVLRDTCELEQDLALDGDGRLAPTPVLVGLYTLELADPRGAWRRTLAEPVGGQAAQVNAVELVVPEE